MKFAAKTFVIKDGSQCILRSPNRDDASQMIELMRTTAGDTDFMLRYPEEITFTLEKEQALLKGMCDDNSSMMIGAFVDGVLAGTISFGPIGGMLKLQHRCQMGIAVKKPYWHMGIGSILMSECINQAREKGFEQMELEVIEENKRAVSLYEKMGFKVYGTRENSFKLKDGRYLSELLMMKEL